MRNDLTKDSPELQAKRRALFLSECSARLDAAYRVVPSPTHDKILAREWARAFHGIDDEGVHNAVDQAIDTGLEYPPRIGHVLLLAMRDFTTRSGDVFPELSTLLRDIERRRADGREAEVEIEDHEVYAECVEIGGPDLWNRDDSRRFGPARKRAEEAFHTVFARWYAAELARVRAADKSDWRLVASCALSASR